ncbi:hypothetical protein [Paludibaculum fermentans]|uniref:hypothetical protein n=1 Tax=Paludibaculum fermentans TaxID=1473598 RepID=UPI003EBA4E48
MEQLIQIVMLLIASLGNQLYPFTPTQKKPVDGGAQAMSCEIHQETGTATCN